MEDRELAYYLEDLNRVHELSLEKLGEWKQKYPYSQVVHFLMAKKHQVEGFVDDMSVYHKASFYAVDRVFLQERMTQSEVEVASLDEVVVEPSFEPVMIKEEEQEDVVEEDMLEEDNVLDSEISVDEGQLEEEGETKPQDSIVTEDLSGFSKWLFSLGGGEESDIVRKRSKKKKKKKKKKSKLEKKIEQSVIKQDEIVSEALANILAMQGHKEKATAMYRKLSLIFPEKSSFFADQIEKLK